MKVYYRKLCHDTIKLQIKEDCKGGIITAISSYLDYLIVNINKSTWCHFCAIHMYYNEQNICQCFCDVYTKLKTTQFSTLNCHYKAVSNFEIFVKFIFHSFPSKLSKGVSEFHQILDVWSLIWVNSYFGLSDCKLYSPCK